MGAKKFSLNKDRWFLKPEKTVVRRGCWLLVTLGYVLLCGGESTLAEALTTADFEGSRLAGWQAFTSSNGTLGGNGFPVLAPCDIAGDGRESQCWQVKVGQLHYSPDQNPLQGGGLTIVRNIRAGHVLLSAKVMVTYHSPNDRRNLAGGLFEWLVDGRVVATFDVGPIEQGGIRRHVLTAKHPIAGGTHTIQLRISRPFKSGTGQQAPLQSFDDLKVEWIPQAIE